MPAPAYAATSTYQGNANRSGGIALPVPTPVAVNNLLIAFVYAESTLTINAPAGWTQLTPTPTTSGAQVSAHRVYWKRATAADAGNYTFTWSGSAWSAGFVTRFVDVIATGSPFEFVDSAARSSSATTTPAVSGTTLGPDRLLVWCGSTWNTATGWTPPSAGGTWSERVDGNQQGLATRLQAAAGATGNVTGSGPSGHQTAWLLALLPSDLSIKPTSIPSAEAFGTPIVVPGTAVVSDAGAIPSAEAFGTPWVGPVQPISEVGGIPSAEAFGTPTVVPGTAVVKPTGIPSAEAFGTAKLVPGLATITGAGGIPSGEEFGIPLVSYGLAQSDLPRAYARIEIPPPAIAYELVCVGRVPQQSGPPLLLEIDPIDWTGLSYADEVSKSQRLDASCQVSKLTDSVVQRLRALDELATELWLYRAGRRVFAGPLLGWQVQGEAITLQAQGLLSYLRFMGVADDLVFNGVDQNLIVKALIDHWQGRPFGNYGIDTSEITAGGQLRDVTYLQKELHGIGQRVDELGRRANGFDIEVDPVTRKVLIWTPQQGVDRSQGQDAIIFDLRNVTSGNIICSAAPGDLASDGFGTGTGNDGTIYATKVNDQLRASFGASWVASSFDGVSEQGTLDAYTQGMIDARSNSLLVPGPDVRTTTDADLQSYDVGDTVAYTLHERLGVSGSFRIRKRTVSVSKIGREKTAIEFV